MEKPENLKNGHTENDEVNRIVHEELTDEFCEAFIEVQKDIWMPETYRKFAKSIKDFEIRDSDVIVASYPKSGTTWTQEMVWLIANDLDYKAAEVDLGSRFPFLEFCTLSNYEKLTATLNIIVPETTANSVEYVNNQKSPRFIKTHLPFSLLPDEIQNGSKSPKIIYVTRNPKDTCVSYLHHGRLFRRWKASLDNFSKVFMAGKAMYGSFWNHIFGYWKQRNSQNFLCIKFEDMKNDLPLVIKQVSEFLNKTLTSEQVQDLCKHLSFESMKNNKAVNEHARIESRRKFNLILEDGAFIRSGTVGKYKEEMSCETVKRLDEWIKKNLEGTDFGLHYNYNL